MRDRLNSEQMKKGHWPPQVCSIRQCNSDSWCQLCCHGKRHRLRPLCIHRGRPGWAISLIPFDWSSIRPPYHGSCTLKTHTRKDNVLQYCMCHCECIASNQAGKSFPISNLLHPVRNWGKWPIPLPQVHTITMIISGWTLVRKWDLPFIEVTDSCGSYWTVWYWPCFLPFYLQFTDERKCIVLFCL